MSTTFRHKEPSTKTRQQPKKPSRKLFDNPSIEMSAKGHTGGKRSHNQAQRRVTARKLVSWTWPWLPELTTQSDTEEEDTDL